MLNGIAWDLFGIQILLQRRYYGLTYTYDLTAIIAFAVTSFVKCITTKQRRVKALCIELHHNSDEICKLRTQIFCLIKYRMSVAAPILTKHLEAPRPYVKYTKLN